MARALRAAKGPQAPVYDAVPGWVELANKLPTKNDAVDAEKRKKMLKERADWEKKHGVTGLKLVGPSKSEQQAAKKRAEERKSNPRKSKGAKPEGDGAGAAPAGLAAAFSEHAIQDLDDPNFGKNLMALSIASKGPAVMPQKLLTDDDWVDALTEVVDRGRRMHKEVVLHTHFNHPNPNNHNTHHNPTLTTTTIP